MGVRYSRYRPAVVRFNMGDLVGHSFAYTKRTNTAAKPGDRVRYRAECTCKWKDPRDEYLPQAAARRRWQGHIAEAEKQGSLL
jgi:hypothetical protein